MKYYNACAISSPYRGCSVARHCPRGSAQFSSLLCQIFAFYRRETVRRFRAYLDRNARVTLFPLQLQHTTEYHIGGIVFFRKHDVSVFVDFLCCYITRWPKEKENTLIRYDTNLLRY